MLLNNEKLSWEWNQVLEKILKLVNDVYKKLRKDTKIFEDFVVETFTTQRIMQHVQILQSYIAISITSGLFKGENIEWTVRTLDIFNIANNRRAQKQRIHYKEFYNDAINKDVNLKDHLIMWIQEREKCRAQGR
jgi:hypothetical protein